MAALVLDKTGTSSANLIINEKHDVSSKTKRIFVPRNGAYFGKGLVIRDASTNKILQPVTGYKMLHMVREAVIETKKEVFAVIMILDTGVLDVIITYQAAGGIYANIASSLEALLDEYLDGRTPTDTIGQIVGAPIQALPEDHIQNIADFQQAGAALSMLEGIRKAILLGDTNAFGAVYEHIDNMFAESMKDLDGVKAYFELLYTQAEQRFTRRNGSIIVTDDDANPGTYTDGKWDRLPNVFLYGTAKDSEVGKTLDVAKGTGLVARKTNFFVRDDDGGGINRVITANKSAINEGENVTFTLITDGLPAGAKLTYNLAGIDAEDITGPLTGEFTVLANGTATVTVQTKLNFRTDGAKVMKLYLSSFPNVYDTVFINDTSQTPTYKVILGANNVGTVPLSTIDEGKSFYATFITTDVPVGTELFVNYGGFASAPDFVTALPSKFVVNASGVHYFPITVKEGFLTEGSGTFTVSLGTSALVEDVKVIGTISINDTSKPKVYVSKWSASPTGDGTISSVNEGDTAYLIISTQNVPQGTVLNLTYSGIASDDLIDAIPTSVTVFNNLVILPVAIRADSVTEGTEVLTMNMLEDGSVVSTAALTINDKSKTPTYNLRYSTNALGSDTIANANEGDTVYAIIETTNVANGTLLATNYSGLSSDDFLEEPARVVTISGNLAAIRFVIKNDYSTEGIETLVMNILRDGTIRATKSLPVTDTSVSVSGSITFSKTTNVSGTINEVFEDESIVYVIYKTVDVPNNTILGISFEGLDAGDLIASFPTTVTIVNNLATISFNVEADWRTEGDQYLTSKLLLPNGSIVQNTLVIRDTSKTPVINRLYYSTATDGTIPVTSVTEKQTVNLYMETTNIPNGTVMPIAWSGTSADNDFTAVRPANVTINNNKGVITFSTNPDYITETTETCIATITLPGANGTRAATLNINDTHRAQTVAIVYNTLPDGTGANVTSVNEGSTVYAIITGTNLVDNELVTLAWGGNVGDLSSAKPTSVPIVGNKASITIMATADLTREDTAESISITVTTPSGVNATASLTINDTSKGYGVATWRTGAATTSTEIPSTGIGEGNLAYLHVNTFGIPANESLTYTWSGTNVNTGDFVSQPSGSFTTSGNAGYELFSLKRDYITEGTETLNVTVSDAKGNVLVTTSVKILDTSIMPTFAAYFATDAGGVNTFTSVDEPTTGIKKIYAVVKTTNMFDGDVVQFTFSGDADNNDFSGTPISTPVNVTINNNIGYYNLKLLADNADG